MEEGHGLLRGTETILRRLERGARARGRPLGYRTAATQSLGALKAAAAPRDGRPGRTSAFQVYLALAGEGFRGLLFSAPCYLSDRGVPPGRFCYLEHLHPVFLQCDPSVQPPSGSELRSLFLSIRFAHGFVGGGGALTFTGTGGWPIKTEVFQEAERGCSPGANL